MPQIRMNTTHTHHHDDKSVFLPLNHKCQAGNQHPFFSLLHVWLVKPATSCNRHRSSKHWGKYKMKKDLLLCHKCLVVSITWMCWFLTISSSTHFNFLSRRDLSPFHGGNCVPRSRIVMLAGVFYTPGRTSKVRQVEG